MLAGTEDHVLAKGFPGSSRMERRHSGFPGESPFPAGGSEGGVKVRSSESCGRDSRKADLSPWGLSSLLTTLLLFLNADSFPNLATLVARPG